MACLTHPVVYDTGQKQTLRKKQERAREQNSIDFLNCLKNYLGLGHSFEWFQCLGVFKILVLVLH